MIVTVKTKVKIFEEEKMKFNSGELQAIIEKNNEILKGEIEKIDRVSEDIKNIDAHLSGYIFYTVGPFEIESLSHEHKGLTTKYNILWGRINPRDNLSLVLHIEEIASDGTCVSILMRKLIETKTDIRLKIYPYLPLIVEKIFSCLKNAGNKP